MVKIAVLILFVAVATCPAELTKPLTIEKLLAVTDEQLKTELPAFDIAYLNLVCARNLPGSESLDIDAHLAKLDDWAQQVERETARNLHLFARNPEQHENSLAYYQIGMLVTVLMQDMGVRFNPELIESGALYDMESTRFYADSSDLFIHGLLSPRPFGTCASMPVLVVAVGRRLGYPLKLVRTKAHLFVRWDAPDERFNVEVTGRGWNPHPDSHYRQWPFPFTKEEEQANRYLKSLSAAESLATFLGVRAVCLKHNKRDAEAKKVLETVTRIYRLYDERFN